MSHHQIAMENLKQRHQKSFSTPLLSRGSSGIKTKESRKQ